MARSEIKIRLDDSVTPVLERHTKAMDRFSLAIEAWLYEQHPERRSPDVCTWCGKATEPTRIVDLKGTTKQWEYRTCPLGHRWDGIRG